MRSCKLGTEQAVYDSEQTDVENFVNELGREQYLISCLVCDLKKVASIESFSRI